VVHGQLLTAPGKSSMENQTVCWQHEAQLCKAGAWRLFPCT